MTTTSGKKTPKTGKAPARRGQRKKTVEKAPVPAEIDKQKMAAFFSAAGLEKTPKPEKEPAKGTVKESVKEPVKVEVAKEAVSKESEVPPPVEPTPTPVSESVPLDESQAIVKESEKVETVVTAAPAAMTVTESENSDSEKGETVMTTNSPATSGGSGSGSFSVLPMIFILAALAVCWFYYVSPVPLKKVANAQVEQGKSEISVLMSKVKVLEDEVTKLRIKLGTFEKATVKAKTSAKKDGAAPAAAVKQDSSFDKAPIPFWRQLKSRGPLTQKSQKKVKLVVETPAVKVDSFSKAPKPFWLKPRVKPVAAKVEKEVQISASPVAKAIPKPKKITSKQEPASAPALDPSFEKAPKPFWVKD